MVEKSSLKKKSFPGLSFESKMSRSEYNCVSAQFKDTLFINGFNILSDGVTSLKEVFV